MDPRIGGLDFVGRIRRHVLQTSGRKDKQLSAGSGEFLGCQKGSESQTWLFSRYVQPSHSGVSLTRYLQIATTPRSSPSGVFKTGSSSMESAGNETYCPERVPPQFQCSSLGRTPALPEACSGSESPYSKAVSFVSRVDCEEASLLHSPNPVHSSIAQKAWRSIICFWI